MKISRSLSIAAGAALLATLSGCVVAPVGPRYHGPYGYAEPVYVAPPAVVVAPSATLLRWTPVPLLALAPPGRRAR